MDYPTRHLDPSAPAAPPDPHTRQLQKPTADSVCAKCGGPLKKARLVAHGAQPLCRHMRRVTCYGGIASHL